VRYEERGQGYRDVEKVAKHCSRAIQHTWSIAVYNYRKKGEELTLDSFFVFCFLIKITKKYYLKKHIKSRLVLLLIM